MIWSLFGSKEERARNKVKKLVDSAYDYVRSGKKEAALDSALLAYQISQRDLGDLSPEFARTLSHLLTINLLCAGRADCERVFGQIIDAWNGDNRQRFTEQINHLIAQLGLVILLKSSAGEADEARFALALLMRFCAAIGPSTNVVLADMLNHASRELEGKGELSLACDLAATVVNIYRETHASHDQDRIIAENRFGLLLKQGGRNDEAITTLHPVLGVVERVANGELVHSTVLNNLGTACAAAQRYSGAAFYLEQALAIRRKLLPAADLNLKATLFNLTDSLCYAGEHARAAPLMEEYLKLDNSADGKLGWSFEQSLYELAFQTYQKRAFADAVAYLKLTAWVQERAGSKHDEARVETLCLVGETEFEMGEYDKAAVNFDMGLLLRRRTGGSGDKYKLNLQRLAECYRRSGDSAAAEPILRELERLP